VRNWRGCRCYFIAREVCSFRCGVVFPDFKAYCVYMSNSLYIEAFMEYREFVDSHSKNEGTDHFCIRRVEKRSVHRPLLDPTGGKEVCP
jgi:hypothetical protein